MRQLEYRRIPRAGSAETPEIPEGPRRWYLSVVVPAVLVSDVPYPTASGFEFVELTSFRKEPSSKTHSRYSQSCLQIESSLFYTYLFFLIFHPSFQPQLIFLLSLSTISDTMEPN